jgi:hypothetical protein
MDRVPMPQFTKRDFNGDPSLEDLKMAYGALVPHFQKNGCVFKLVGRYAVFLHGSFRHTKDLDFAFDLESLETVRDVVVSMEISNLVPLATGGGFGYLVAPGNLVEVDLLDRRLFQFFQLVPDSI